MALLLAVLIGVIAGLRSMTAPAIVAWAAHLHWIDLHDSRLGFMGSTVAVVIFTLFALVELAADKRPSTPSRTTVMGFIPRVVLGGLAGATVAVAGAQSAALGALLGVVGAIVGTFAWLPASHAPRRCAQGSRRRHRLLGRFSRHRWRASYRLETLGAIARIALRPAMVKICISSPDRRRGTRCAIQLSFGSLLPQSRA